MERLTNTGSNGKIWITDNDETRRLGRKETAYKKLAEYEDLEEVFRDKITNETCELLRDKEEFSKWLDLIEWIAKRCDNYIRTEEQGLLLRLPCKIGDTVYYIEDNKVNKFVVYSFDIRPLQQFVCNYEGIRLNFKNFDKTVFLTQAEAEQKLKEIEKTEEDYPDLSQ